MQVDQAVDQSIDEPADFGVVELVELITTADAHALHEVDDDKGNTEDRFVLAQQDWPSDGDKRVGQGVGDSVFARDVVRRRRSPHAGRCTQHPSTLRV